MGNNYFNMNVCRKAVHANAALSFDRRGYDLPEAARCIAAVEAKAAPETSIYSVQ